MNTLLLVSRNEKENLDRFLPSLERQTKKPDEIVVVDSSDDGSQERLKAIADRFIISEPKGCSPARALGMKNTRGDVIVWTDCDCELAKDWFENITKPFPKADVVQGSVKVHSFDKKEGGMFADPNGQYICGCNVAFKKSVLDEFPVDENMLWEDIELGYRIAKKYEITNEPLAKVIHFGLAKSEQRSLKNNAQWSGKAWARILKKHRNIYWLLRIYYNIFNVPKANGWKAFAYYFYYFHSNLFSESKGIGRKVV